MMNMRLNLPLRGTFAAILAAGLLLAAPLSRGDSTSNSAAPHFANLSDLDSAAVLPPPPAVGSLAAQADLETDLQVQASRTPEQAAWVQLADRFDPWILFGYGNLLGPRYTKTDLPRLAALFDELKSDVSPLVAGAKQRYARPRPFVADSRIQPCAERPTSNSYPSSHSFSAYEYAAVLAEIYPEKRAELLERARRISWSRVIGGVHFPTDLEGGRRLAEAVMAAELKNPAFRAAIEECRHEASAAPR